MTFKELTWAGIKLGIALGILHSIILYVLVNHRYW